MQYNNLKYHLEQIENKIDTMNTTLNKALVLNNDINSIINSKNIFIVLILCLLSLLIALILNRFSFFGN